MIYLAAAVLLTLVIIGYTLLVRPSDLPDPEAIPAWQHLEARKGAIYENLRDLQFEYRLGKLSDADYQRTKQELQAELAAALAEIDRLKQGGMVQASPKAKSQRTSQAKAQESSVCPHCGAKFDQALKFCGECGKSMATASAPGETA